MSASFFIESLGLKYGPCNYNLPAYCMSDGNTEAINTGFNLAYGDENTCEGQPNLIGNVSGEIHRIRASQGEGPVIEGSTAAAIMLPSELGRLIMSGANRELTSGNTTQPDNTSPIATARFAVHGPTSALLVDSVSEVGSMTQLVVANSTEPGQQPSRTHYSLWVPFDRDGKSPVRRLHARHTDSDGMVSEVQVQTLTVLSNGERDCEITATETPGPNNMPTRTTVSRKGLSDEFFYWQPSEEDKIPGPGVHTLGHFISALSIFRITSKRGSSYDLLSPEGVNRYNAINRTNTSQAELIAKHLGELGLPQLESTIRRALPEASS